MNTHTFENILVFAGITLTIVFLRWIFRLHKQSKEYDAIHKQLMESLGKEAELKKEFTAKYVRLAEYKERLDKKKQRIQKQRVDIQTIANEKTVGFPWLAEAYADYFYLQDLEIAEHLENKSHPAVKSAERIREVATKRRIVERGRAK
jgi:hypothetical protein